MAFRDFWLYNILHSSAWIWRCLQALIYEQVVAVDFRGFRRIRNHLRDCNDSKGSARISKHLPSLPRSYRRFPSQWSAGLFEHLRRANVCEDCQWFLRIYWYRRGSPTIRKDLHGSPGVSQCVNRAQPTARIINDRPKETTPD